MSKYIELYSGNRNRNLYPLPASYEVPFSATLQNISPNKSQDPVVNGSIYYTFTLYPQSDQYAIKGKFKDGTNAYNLYLDPTMNNITGNDPYSYIPNYYKGYIILRTLNPTETRIIRSYDPTNGLIMVDSPFTSASPGDDYEMYQSFPENRNYIYIPTIDDNYNTIANYELAYNGYYIIFETPNSNYSNSDNSNIFYRKITYYDYNYQIAYYDKPLEFNYDYINDPPQTYTLRKTLPMQRWTLPLTTYNNNISPVNDQIGPLIGPVITLPETASNVDNFYAGKYVYFYNNQPETYKNIYPQPETSLDPISNLVFYPIYGLYYIKAYNSITKQLSVSYDNTKYYDVAFPTYSGVSYNIFYFKSNYGVSSINRTNTTLKVIFDNISPYEAELYLDPNYFVIGKTYSFNFSLENSTFGVETSPMTLTVKDDGNIVYSSPGISQLQTLNFSITPTTTNITFVFNYYPDPLDLSLEYSVIFNNLNITGLGYNSSSFLNVSGITSIINLGYSEYKATLDNISPYEAVLGLDPPFVIGDTFNICWALKVNSNINNAYFVVDDGISNIYVSPYITSNYQYISFSIIPQSSDVKFYFYYNPVDENEKSCIQWQYFFVLDKTIQENPIYNYNFSAMNTINIATFNNDNFNPLSYNGSMLSLYQTVCYSISLLSITLPNIPLKTGSRIAFYPYVYVEFANATTPNGASKQIIYSNNPNSNRALFIAPVTQLLQPEANTFITLSGGTMSQIIKFKPNDNLRFSVYLPDGSLFQTLDIDTLPPYSHQPDLQIDAVFSITRLEQSSSQEMP